jgi:hypothetical protein
MLTVTGTKNRVKFVPHHNPLCRVTALELIREEGFPTGALMGAGTCSDISIILAAASDADKPEPSILLSVVAN